MPVTINIHNAAFRPLAYDATDQHPAFSTVEIHGDGFTAAVFLDTDERCDDLIRAACLAKDMRHAREHAAAMAPLPDRGRYDAPSAEAVAADLPDPVSTSDGWDMTACQECGSREGKVVAGWHAECRAYREGLAVRDIAATGLVPPSALNGVTLVRPEVPGAH